MKRNLSADGAVFLATVTSILFTWSTAHYHGFLSAMGLDADMMERSFHQVMYSGLIVSFVPVIISLIIAAMCLYLYSLVFLPLCVDYIKGSFRAKRQYIKFRRFWIGSRESLKIELDAKKLFSRVALTSLAATIYIVSLVYFENLGSAKADQIMNDKSHDSHESKLINVKIDNNNLRLVYLTCGTKYCAGLERKTKRIYYFSESYSFLHTRMSEDKN